MKNKKKLIKRIVTIVVVVGVLGFGALQLFGPREAPVVLQRAQPLTIMDLRNTVDVTGTVESEDKHRIHTTLVLPVLSVAVEVGDVVGEGDLLCLLDSSTLETDIQSRRASMNISASNSGIALQQAQNELYYAEWYTEHDRNERLLSAQSAVDAAERSLRTAEFDLRTAQRRLDDAHSDNRDARSDGNPPTHDGSALDTLRDSVSQAQIRVEGAEASLAEAKERYSRTHTQVQRDFQEMRDAIARAENSANQTTDYIALNKLLQDLADCTVTAPAAGTVTAVYATEGFEARGLLFVIEDTGSLVVETTVKEFDVNTVKVGQKVMIRSDATGDEVYEGEVLSIAPASVKNDAGLTITGGTAEYATKVRVTSAGHALRIGMNVRLNIILEQKEQTLAVLYDAVTAGPDGESVVYVAQPQEDGSHLARMIPVQTGMETDLYLEVSSPGLTEGDLVLQDVAMLYDGMPVTVAPSVADMAGGPSGRRGGMAVRVG